MPCALGRTQHPRPARGIAVDDIHQRDATPFAFDLPEHGLVGFGRCGSRTDYHLARIIVSPLIAGGFGRALCTALMREAVRLHPASPAIRSMFSRTNRTIALYRSSASSSAACPHLSLHAQGAPLSFPPRIADCVP